MATEEPRVKRKKVDHRDLVAAVGGDALLEGVYYLSMEFLLVDRRIREPDLARQAVSGRMREHDEHPASRKQARHRHEGVPVDLARPLLQ